MKKQQQDNNPARNFYIRDHFERREKPPCINTGVCTERFFPRVLGVVMTIIIYLLSASYSFAQQTKIDSLEDILKKPIHDTIRVMILMIAIISIFSNLELLAQSEDKGSSKKIVVEKTKAGIPLSKADSLRSLLKSGLPDTARVDIMLMLFKEIKSKDPERAMQLADSSHALARKTGYKYGMAASLCQIAMLYIYSGEYDKAERHCREAIILFDEMTKKTGENTKRAGNDGLAKTENILGMIFDYKSEYDQAIKHYLNSLEIYEETGNKKGFASSLNNIGVFYIYQKDDDSALEYFLRSLTILTELGNKRAIASLSNNIGIIYLQNGEYAKAIQYFVQSLEVLEEFDSKREIADCLGNIGAVYQKWENYERALEYHQRSLKMAEELGDRNGMAISILEMGRTYDKLGYHDKAIEHFHKSLAISKAIGRKQDIMDAYRALASSSVNNNNYKGAYEYYQHYTGLKDSLFNEEKSKEIGRLEAKYEYDKQLTLQEAEREKEAELATAESRRQKGVIYAVSGGLGLMLILAFLIYRGYRQKQKANLLLERKNATITRQKKEIEEKNKDITDSIRYAQNIQKAILPPVEEIKKTLHESFILFKPKDIVSGDFYFFSRVNQYTIIAACDCTGHGVPGAFMSMIGSQLLNEIVNDKSVTDAAEVLNQLRDGIIHALGDAGATGGQKDGMDMALCTFQYKKDNGIVNLQFAGAYNPLYLIREGELQQIKADKQPVGFHFGKQMPFTNHEMQLKKGDTIYIFSDGYQDQFGGPRGKKFMSKQFRQLFIDIQTMNMEEQKEHLDKTIEEWKGSKEQVDDILVIGVRV